MRSFAQHPAPYVVGGVNYTAERFHEHDSWAAALAADSLQAALPPHRYGLLIPEDGGPALRLEKHDSQLVLSRCFGVAPSGYLIAIFEGGIPPLGLSLNNFELLPREDYRVLVEIDRNELCPFGSESEDLPSRPRHCLPYRYRLHVQPVSQALTERPEALPIGLLRMENGSWELGAYVPPCAHIGAHPGLADACRRYIAALESLAGWMPEVIRQTDAFRDKAMIELREFVMQLGSYLAVQRPALNALTQRGAPFQLISFWAAFANLASFLLRSLADRPGFYNLLYHNTRGANGVYFTPEALDAALQALAQPAYNHNRIDLSLEAIDNFLGIFAPVIKALANGTLRPIESPLGWEQAVSPPVEKKPNHATW